MTLEEFRAAAHQCENDGGNALLLAEMVRDFEYQVTKGNRLFKERTDAHAEIMDLREIILKLKAQILELKNGKSTVPVR